MKLSIIICTFNKAVQLEQLLEDLSYQIARLRKDDSAQVEIILVDNNSTDNTKEIAYRFTESTLLSMKYFVEERYGLSRARNFAITKASGDLLAFIHDDITLDEDWLKEVFKLADKCKEREIGIYGGRSIPLWQDRVPDWLNIKPPHSVDQRVFSGHNYGDAELFYPFQSESGIAKFPSGAHFLVRRDIFENCGDFRTDLGPSAAGDTICVNEDYEYFEYLATLKIPLLYVPQCIVFHPVMSEEMNQQYIRKWYLKHGKSLYWIAFTDRVKRKPEILLAEQAEFSFWSPLVSTENKIFEKPVYLYIKAFSILVWYCFAMILFDKAKSNWLMFQFCRCLGEFEAAEMVDTKIQKKKFSFRDRVKTIDYEEQV